MFESGFTAIDFFHIGLLLATCFACYVAGRIRGASGLIALMLAYDVVTEKQLDDFQKKLEED
jgi:hypothetical protein